MFWLKFLSGAFSCRDLTAQRELERKVTAERRCLLSAWFHFPRPVHFSASPPSVLNSFELLQHDILSALLPAFAEDLTKMVCVTLPQYTLLLALSRHLKEKGIEAGSSLSVRFVFFFALVEHAG